MNIFLELNCSRIKNRLVEGYFTTPQNNSSSNDSNFINSSEMYTTISMTSITPSLHEKKIIIKQMKILPQDIFFFSLSLINVVLIVTTRLLFY